MDIVDKLSPEAKAEFEQKRQEMGNDIIRRPFPILKVPVIISAVMLGVVCFACAFSMYSAHGSK